MKVELVRIFPGIPIPKSQIEQYGYSNTVELHREQDRLVILPS